MTVALKTQRQKVVLLNVLPDRFRVTLIEAHVLVEKFKPLRHRRTPRQCDGCGTRTVGHGA